MLYDNEFMNIISIFHSYNEEDESEWSVVFFNEDKIYENHSLDFAIVMEKLAPLINDKIKLETYEVSDYEMFHLKESPFDLGEFLSAVNRDKCI